MTVLRNVEHAMGPPLLVILQSTDASSALGKLLGIWKTYYENQVSPPFEREVHTLEEH